MPPPPHYGLLTLVVSSADVSGARADWPETLRLDVAPLVAVQREFRGAAAMLATACDGVT